MLYWIERSAVGTVLYTVRSFVLPSLIASANRLWNATLWVHQLISCWILQTHIILSEPSPIIIIVVIVVAIILIRDWILRYVAADFPFLLLLLLLPRRMAIIFWWTGKLKPVLSLMCLARRRRSANERTTIAGTSNGRAKSLKFHEITQFRCFPTTTPNSLLTKWNANKSHAGFPVLFELCALKYKTYIYGLQHNRATAKCYLAALFVRCSNITTQGAPLVGVGGRLVALGCVKKI